MVSCPMSDDPINDGCDGSDAFIEDPRISDMISHAFTITELVLNAEFLLDDYATRFLEKTCPETLRLVRQQRMTPEQKFHLALGASCELEDTDYGGQESFGFLRELYRIRAMAGKASEDKLLGELMSAYIRTGGEEARQIYQGSYDVERTVRSMVADRLLFAQCCLVEVAYPGEQ